MSTRFRNTVRFGIPERTDTAQSDAPAFGKTFNGVFATPKRNRGMSAERSYALSVIAQHSIGGSVPFQIVVDETGEIAFFFSGGNEAIEDNDVIKELKRIPQVKELLTLALEQQAKTRHEIENYSTRATRSFVDLYELAPRVQTKESAEERLAAIEPEVYKRREFGIPRPEIPRIEAELDRIAHARATGLFKERKAGKFFAEKHDSYIRAVLGKWYDEKTQFEAIEDEIEKTFNEEHRKMYEDEKRMLENALGAQGDPTTVIEEWLHGLDLSFEMEAGLLCKSGTAYIDLDLPEIEDLPKTVTKRLRSGEVKSSDKTQKQLREEYVDCVLGLALFMAANVLNLTYEIDEVDISGFTQRRNDKGDMVDTYIYSVIIPRERMVGMAIGSPLTSFEHFENRMKLSASSTFGAIEPYEYPEK